jgi:hypothetical protein
MLTVPSPNRFSCTQRCGTPYSAAYLGAARNSPRNKAVVLFHRSATSSGCGFPLGTIGRRSEGIGG